MPRGRIGGLRGLHHRAGAVAEEEQTRVERTVRVDDHRRKEADMGCLRGRVAVVTGAGRGLGRQYALQFAAEGASVLVNDLGGDADGDGKSSGPAHSVVSEIVNAGGTAVADTNDVASANGADSLIGAAIDAFGTVDVLVNNAGVLRDRPIAAMEDDDWDISLRVNLRGHFMPMRAAARHWRTVAKSGGEVTASIINTSSESGVFANATQASYAAAKSGVAALSEVASKELARYGVRSNAILPRARTRLTDGLTPAPKPGQYDKWDPANVVPFVAYLASAPCTITGQVFLVAGDGIQRVAPWSLDPTWRIEIGARWSPDDFVHAVAAIGMPENSGRLTGNVR
jgi:NAD(P)-dependent dehydrogenase (short-subunit alcohol dehydrogenase family)